MFTRQHQHWIDKPLHGQFFKNIDDICDKQATCPWLWEGSGATGLRAPAPWLRPSMDVLQKGVGLGWRVVSVVPLFCESVQSGSRASARKGGGNCFTLFLCPSGRALSSLRCHLPLLTQHHRGPGHVGAWGDLAGTLAPASIPLAQLTTKAWATSPSGPTEAMDEETSPRNSECISPDHGASMRTRQRLFTGRNRGCPVHCSRTGASG